jgi:hypothetical protein
MTIELALCIVFMFAAFPVSRSVAAHYFVFAFVNLALAGVCEVDASLLAMIFAILACADALLVMMGGRKILLVSGIASGLLCIESIANQDWLLSHVTYLSVATNAVIAASLAKEFSVWMRGKLGR